MTGSALVQFDSGWGCSNEVSMIVERDIIKDEKGEMVSKHTSTLRLMGYFKGKGQVFKDAKVYCIFKSESEQLIQSFVATVSGVTEEMVVLILSERSNRDLEILNNIKQLIKEEKDYGK